MLTGRGTQKFLKESYEDDRQKALENRDRYDDDELIDLEITTDQGRGKTDYRKYQLKQWISLDVSIRPRRKIDLRNRPQIGGGFNE